MESFCSEDTPQHIRRSRSVSAYAVRKYNSFRTPMDRARRLLLLNQELQPYRREILQILIYWEYLSLLSDKSGRCNAHLSLFCQEHVGYEHGAEPQENAGPLRAIRDWLKRNEWHRGQFPTRGNAGTKAQETAKECVGTAQSEWEGKGKGWIFYRYKYSTARRKQLTSSNLQPTMPLHASTPMLKTHLSRLWTPRPPSAVPVHSLPLYSSSLVVLPPLPARLHPASQGRPFDWRCPFF